MLDSHAPKKSVRVKEHNAPNKNLLSQKAQKTKDSCDWEKYRKLKNKVGKTLCKAEKEYFEEVARNQGNPQAVWKDLNKVMEEDRENI